MRDEIAQALNAAMSGQDKRRIRTLRLITAALRDKDAAHRGAGREKLANGEIAEMLKRMICQRESAATAFDAGGRVEDACGERAEIAVIREFLPAPLPAGEVEAACRQAVTDTGSKGLRDVGRCMNALKERYQDKLNLIEASSVVRGLLS